MRPRSDPVLATLRDVVWHGVIFTEVDIRDEPWDPRPCALRARMSILREPTDVGTTLCPSTSYGVIRVEYKVGHGSWWLCYTKVLGSDAALWPSLDTTVSDALAYAAEDLNPDGCQWRWNDGSH